MSWLADNGISLVVAMGSLAVATVTVLKARREVRVNRAEVRRERAIVALESLYDALCIVDAQSIIVECNGQMRLMTGYSRDELIGMHVNTLLPQEYRKDHVQHMRGYHASPYPRQMGAKRNLPLYLLTKAGDKTRVRISLRPLEGPTGNEVIVCLHALDDDTAA